VVNFAFFSAYTAGNATEAAYVEKSWFGKKGPIGGDASMATIALEQTIVADRADSNGANDQLNYPKQFNQNFDLMSGSGGLNEAGGFCADQKELFNLTWSFVNNFATNGSRLDKFVPEYNGQGDVVGVDPTVYIWDQSTLLSGIEISDSVNAAHEGIKGFENQLIAPNGDVYLEGDLPIAGTQTIINENGGKKPTQDTPAGSQTHSQHNINKGTESSSSKQQKHSTAPQGIVTAITTSQINPS